MDEILKRFEKTVGADRVQADESHKDMYKNWGKYGNQEERRNEILRQQKNKRENKLDAYRGILNLLESVERSNVFGKPSTARYQPTVYVPGFNNRSNLCYNNVLMLSEWMVEKPEDFESNWFLIPCPKGTRTLVVACGGKTICYTKYGQLCHITSTLLPGGNVNDRRKNSSVLDCFYCKDTNTMYVLDILSWNNHIMADGEFEFRRYWLETTFRENPEIERVTKRNKMSFTLLPITPCDQDCLQKFMMIYSPYKVPKLDGLLFYHKHGHYVAGETPLVGWLFPYMVPEVLYPGMTIHELYEIGKPHDYVNQATFIQKFDEKFDKKKNRKKKKSQDTSETTMDAEDVADHQEDSGENDITEHNVNANTDGDGDIASNMELELASNGEKQGENTENLAENTANQKSEESAQVPIQFMNLFSYYDQTQQQANITKYYSYFN